MKLLSKYSKEFAPLLKNKALIPLLSGIEIADPSTDDLSQFDPKKTICIGHKTPVGEALEQFKKYEIEHFVQVDREGFFLDLFAASLMLQKPAAFLKNPMPFFISNFNSTDADTSKVRSMTKTFTGSADKPVLLEALADFCDEHPKTSNFIETVHMMADELLMNALYDAPTDSAGRHKFISLDRSIKVKYDGEKVGKLFISHDERRLLIGCEDPYGSVTRYRLLSRVMRAYKDGDKTEPIGEEGGAGLGCKMMIDAGCGFYMVAKKQERTLACCALPLGVSYMKAERMSKNLHFVFI